jgi:hypothetical protein
VLRDLALASDSRQAHQTALRASEFLDALDARENADHNALARRAADEIARGFRCDIDQVKVIGKRGRAIELLGP